MSHLYSQDDIDYFSGNINPFDGDENAKISLYVNAEFDDDWGWAFDDGQDWMLLMETSLGVFPLFPRKYVQLGTVSYTVQNVIDTVYDYVIDNETTVLVTIAEGAGLLMYECIFDREKKAFKVASVYDRIISHFTRSTIIEKPVLKNEFNGADTLAQKISSEAVSIVSNKPIESVALLTDATGENLYAETLQILAEEWARAYCRRDGNTLYGLCYNKDLFFELGGDIVEEDGHKRIGISSPWPWNENEARVIVDEEKVDYILCWRTSSSIDLVRSKITYIQTDKGFQVTGIEIPHPSASSKTAFDYLYAFGFPPFEECGNNCNR